MSDGIIIFLLLWIIQSILIFGVLNAFFTKEYYLVNSRRTNIDLIKLALKTIIVGSLPVLPLLILFECTDRAKHGILFSELPTVTVTRALLSPIPLDRDEFEHWNPYALREDIADWSREMQVPVYVGHTAALTLDYGDEDYYFFGFNSKEDRLQFMLTWL